MAIAVRQATIPDVPWAGGELARALGLVVAVVLVALVTLVLLGPLLSDTPRARGLAALAVSGAVQGGMLLSVWLYALRRRGATWAQVGYRPLGLAAAAIHVPATMVLALFTLGLYGLVVRSLGILALQPAPIPEVLLTDRVTRGVLGVLTVGVAPAIEEGFFRGFAFTALRRRWGTWRAAGASALLFGLFHASPGLIIPTALLGLLLVYLYRRTGSVWSCVLVHAGFNALSLTLAT